MATETSVFRQFLDREEQRFAVGDRLQAALCAALDAFRNTVALEFVRDAAQPGVPCGIATHTTDERIDL